MQGDAAGFANIQSHFVPIWLGGHRCQLANEVFNFSTLFHPHAQQHGLMVIAFGGGEGHAEIELACLEGWHHRVEHVSGQFLLGGVFFFFQSLVA